MPDEERQWFPPLNCQECYSIRMTEAAFNLEVKADGRVQLPAGLRERLQLTTGSRLIVRVQDAGHAELVTAAALASELRGFLREDGSSMADELLRDRRAEVAREQQE